MKPFIVLAVVFVVGCSHPPRLADYDPQPVSLLRLIATPERFDGCRVSTVGYSALGYDESLLFMGKEDFDQRICWNSVSLGIGGQDFLACQRVNQMYVEVTGVYRKDGGYFFNGTISPVESVWCLTGTNAVRFDRTEKCANTASHGTALPRRP